MISRSVTANRILVAAVTLMAALTLVVSYVVSERAVATGSAARSADSFAMLRLEASEAEHYDSLAAMKRSADAIVMGRVVSFGVSRTVRGDHPLDVVVYGSAVVDVRRQVSGRDLGGSVAVEFLLPYQPADAAKQAAAFNAELPRGEALMFLRHKGGAEAGRYRLVNSAGLWAGTTRAAVDTPLTDEAPASSLTAGLGPVRSVDQLADRLARV
ncbi:hypothetical protein [Jidongwangia harbinensis]|uniref:hypothetical protein n=1 Tax=Jidongwangia harbinensis TaxID=2878561 RepID=UPI001CD941C5|nr:hypothetical protein [Jidongwangia harbinensis]MCA2219245.1 hypothetical protein [Jidongwangia harbinensis]